jgi:hypothetical protein
MRRRLPRGWLLASWIALGLSTGLVAAAAVAALWLAPLPSGGPAQPNEVSLALAGRAAGAPVAARPLPNDPFRPGRQLPNAVASAASAPADTVLPVSVVTVRLLGTIVRPNGSFAVCQLTTDAPKIVHVGERLGELTLIILEQGRAVFQTPRGARLELALAQPRS